MHVATKALMSVAVALAIGSLTAPEAEAQTSIPSSEAAQFMGEWDLPLQAEQPVTLGLNIRDNGGQVAADVIAQGNSSPVTTISKTEGKLVLSYNLDLGGQQAPISITLTPEGSNLTAVLDVAQGMFTANGTATKKQ